MKIYREFEYKLMSPIKYAHGGSNVEGTLLIISAPSNKQMKYAAKLKQAVIDAMGKLRKDYIAADNEQIANKVENKGASEANKVDPDTYLLFMNMGGVDMDNIYSIFERLICDGQTCLIDGKEPMKATYFADMDFRDTEKVLGEYISHFFM